MLCGIRKSTQSSLFVLDHDFLTPQKNRFWPPGQREMCVSKGEKREACTPILELILGQPGQGGFPQGSPSW